MTQQNGDGRSATQMLTSNVAQPFLVSRDRGLITVRSVKHKAWSNPPAGYK